MLKNNKINKIKINLKRNNTCKLLSIFFACLILISIVVTIGIKIFSNKEDINTPKILAYIYDGEKHDTPPAKEAGYEIDVVNCDKAIGSPNNDNGTYIADDSDLLNAQYVYTHERANTHGKICRQNIDYCLDTVTRTTSWIGQVALIYPSDYLYATSGGRTTSREECLNKGMFKWNTGYCYSGNWLFDYTNHQWTLSPHSYKSFAHNMDFIHTDGRVSNTLAYGSFAVRPAVFLKSNISIIDGAGTSTDPYILQ